MRVLGNLLGLDGFEFNSSEEVLKAYLPADLSAVLSNAIPEQAVAGVALNGKLELAAFAPIYDTDALVRRAESLRETKAAKPALAQISVQTAETLGVKSGDKIQLTDSEGGTLCAAVLVNKTIAENTVLVPVRRADTQSLRNVLGGVAVEAVVAIEVQA